MRIPADVAFQRLPMNSGFECEFLSRRSRRMMHVRPGAAKAAKRKHNKRLRATARRVLSRDAADA